MNLVTIDTSPGNMSMYIAPNNTKYLQMGANTSTIQIGPLTQNTGAQNVSTFINGVRIDSNTTNNNLIVTFSSNSYSVNNYPSTNFNNTIVSNTAFSANMSGNHCTAVGHNCLTNNSTGIRNTAIGAGAAQSLTTANYNTALGSRALASATTDSNQVAIGYNALTSSVISNYPNVAVGTYALQSLNNSICGANVAVGHQALGSLTNGTGNVAIGYLADNAPQDANNFSVNTTGSGNVCIGNQATSKGYSNCIVLGQNAYATAADQIILGSVGGGHTTYIQGSGGLNVNAGPTSLMGLTAGTTSLGTTTTNNLTINAGNTFTSNGPTIFGTNQAQGFPTAMPSNGAGLVLAWNVNSSYSQGDTSFLNYAQFGTGGFRFYTANNQNANNYVTKNLAPIACGSLSSSGSAYLGATTIYEATGTVGGENGVGSLVIDHGNSCGVSSIIFPSRGNRSSDYGYIRYRDDVDNVLGYEQSRLEIGVENDFGAAGGVIDALILNKRGGYVGVGQSNPLYTLDVSGSGRFTRGLTINNNQTYIGNSASAPTIYCSLGISTLNNDLRDGIAIKASATNDMAFMQFINQAGSIIGQISNTGGGTGTSYVTTSDRRLKKDIIPMENILDKIMLLKPCNYNWISNNTSSFGFIAQEVFEIFPKLYNEIPNSDGNIDEPRDKDTGVPLHYGIDYGRFTPYIVKAIQEQNTIVTNLQKENEDLKSTIEIHQTEINNLKTKNELLESRLSAIEARLAAGI